MSEASGEAAAFTTRGRAKVEMMENNFMVDWSFDWLRTKGEIYERYDGKGRMQSRVRKHDR
jgi:hypothetical protein